MIDELWTSAKHIAQSDGRKDDWVYVMDVYKSIGGNSMALVIYNSGKRLEIMSEISKDKILVCNSSGELEIVEKSIYTRARKKFYKKEIDNATPIKKSISNDGKTYVETIYKGAKYL